jgi:hypothetical protein
MTTAARHGRKARKPLVVSVVLVDCLIYRGLRCSLRRHAAPSPDRDQSATTRMKKAHYTAHFAYSVAEAGETRAISVRYVAPPAHVSPGEIHDAEPTDEDTPAMPSHPGCLSRVKATATPSGAGQLPRHRDSWKTQRTVDNPLAAQSTLPYAPAFSACATPYGAGKPQAARLQDDPTRARRPERRCCPY